MPTSAPRKSARRTPNGQPQIHPGASVAGVLQRRSPWWRLPVAAASVGVLTLRVGGVAGSAGSPPAGHIAQLRPPASATASPCTATLTGKVVSFDMSGFEPDFDPIDRVVIAATLHTLCGAAARLPDITLILSTYLENFQPDTTPILPDLLQPNRMATHLGGFMQGKAALVNAGGALVYQGSALAEVFLNNETHLVITLARPLPLPAAALHLHGTFMLHKDLRVGGYMQTTRGLLTGEVAALRVLPSRPAPTIRWQVIVQMLSVHKPPMMGTASSTTPSGQVQPQPQPAPPLHQTGGDQSWRLPLASGLIVSALAMLFWRLRALTAARVRDRRAMGNRGEDRPQAPRGGP